MTDPLPHYIAGRRPDHLDLDVPVRVFMAAEITSTTPRWAEGGRWTDYAIDLHFATRRGVHISDPAFVSKVQISFAGEHGDELNETVLAAARGLGDGVMVRLAADAQKDMQAFADRMKESFQLNVHAKPKPPRAVFTRGAPWE